MRRTSSSNSGHPQQHLHQHGTRRPRSGSGDGSTDGFDNKKNAAAHQNQKKPFIFGVLLGATVAYSLSALSESIRLSHAVHHYVHHEVSDFNLLGIGGPGKRTTNRGRKMKKKEDAEDSDEGSGGDDGDSDVDSEDKTGKVNAGINEDVTDDALLENLKAAAAAKREDENRMRPGMPRFGGNNGGGQDERKKKLLERLEMRRQQEQQQKEQNKKQIVHPVNPNNNLSKLEVAKRPKKEHTFDERIAQNMGRQPPQDQNARFAKDFPYQLDAPITDKALDDLDLRDICDVEKNVLNVKEARRICLEGKLPDYTHPKPHFLPSTDDEEVWLKQPENEISIKEVSLSFCRSTFREAFEFAFSFSSRGEPAVPSALHRRRRSFSSPHRRRWESTASSASPPPSRQLRRSIAMTGVHEAAMGSDEEFSTPFSRPTLLI